MTNQSGLTLVELLLALFITAFMSVAGVGLTRQTLAASAEARHLIADVEALGVARALVESDLAALAGRDIDLSDTGGGARIAFTRLSAPFPGAAPDPPYSVAYILDDTDLVRQTGLGDTRSLLAVTDMRAEFLGPAGWTESWPPPDHVSAPRALALIVTGARWGEITLVFAVSAGIGPQ